MFATVNCYSQVDANIQRGPVAFWYIKLIFFYKTNYPVNILQYFTTYTCGIYTRIIYIIPTYIQYVVTSLLLYYHIVAG